MQNETVRALKDIYETQCLHAKNLIVLAEAVNGAIAIIKQNPPHAEGEHETAMRVYGEYEKARWAKAFKDSTVCGIILFRDWLTTKIAEGK